MAAKDWTGYREPRVRASRHVVAGLFGRVAGDYDRAGFLHAIARQLVRRAGVLPGDRVLDLACGTGAAALEATRFAGQDGVVIGVDLAEPMVAQAASRLRALGWSRGGVAVMDAERLGLRPRSFDVVCCASVDLVGVLQQWGGGAGTGLRAAPRLGTCLTRVSENDTLRTIPCTYAETLQA